jgi:hypothetical protein
MSYRRIKRATLSLVLMTLAVTAHASAASDIQSYLPSAASFEADYVIVAPDPAYDGHGQKLQAAMREHAEWLREYTAKHPNERPLPYHPNFGVPKDLYYKYQNPMNQYIEVSRQRIRVTQQRTGAVIKLTFQGQQLILDTLEIDTATPAVKTAKEPLQFMSKVQPGRATFPPGAFEGYRFDSLIENIRKMRIRENVIIGRLTDGAKGGIIHYEFNTGKPTYAYVTFPLK